MKIAIVTSKINSVGGVEIVSKNISDILTKRGHNVTIIGQESLPEIPEKDVEQKIGEYFNQLHKSNSYDVVICNGEFGYAVNHPRAINLFHGGYYGYALSVKDLVPKEVTENRLEKAEMQKESAKWKYVVTVSEFAKEWLEKGEIVVDEVINNSINTNLFYPEKENISNSAIALVRGRYYEKGIDVLENLAERGINIKLFSDFKIKSTNIKNIGFKDYAELAKKYNSAQLLLHPSRFEGGSLVTIEAMACGCPIITTPTGYGVDIKKIIPNFVANPDDIKEFLAKYVLLTNEREKYSQKALDYFREFHNPETFKSKWISLVERI